MFMACPERLRCWAAAEVGFSFNMLGTTEQVKAGHDNFSARMGAQKRSSLN
jgi:hypothetical protein